MMQETRAVVVTMTAALVFVSGCNRVGGSPQTPSNAEPQIKLNLAGAESGTVDIVGLSAEDLSWLQRRPLTHDEWAALLRVSVAGNRDASADRPPVFGTHTVSGSVIRFVPQFPFDPGRRYQVVFDPTRLPAPARGRVDPWRSRRIETTIGAPAPKRHASTRIVEVYPTGREVPENQLRLYIYFSAPMSFEGGLDHIHLLDGAGHATEDPFLPLDVNLWNADRTRYTVLFDPGRVKRGVLPNEQKGRSLIRGRKYTLVVEESWHDAEGQPLIAGFRRKFQVGRPEEHPIDPTRWRLDAPTDGTRDPLTVSFPTPLDYALLLRTLSVWKDRGDRLEGDIRIEASETRWIFTPHEPWRGGTYRLMAASILEDVAGNRIGKAFEVDALTGPPGAKEAHSATLPFRLLLRGR
jgi:hypothetical protein